jgi:hypothetical protein
MKRFGKICSVAIVVLCGAVLGACSEPKIIPDEELAEIFRDAYLTNAYVQIRYPQNLDSLNLYEPIFAKYGYTTEDVQFTIGNFAKRKNARMTDVVDKAVEMLGTVGRFYQWRLAIIDSIGGIARQRYAKVVYADTIIRVRRIADTARLRIEIPIKEPGTYDVSYYYTLDSTDHNPDLRASHYLLDERGARSATNSRRLSSVEQERYTASFPALPSHRKLVLNLNGYAGRGEITRPNLTIDSLIVTRYLPEKVALDSMARELFDYRHIDTLAWPRHGWPRADSVVYIIQPDSTYVLSKTRG